jgi:hypothetical protein
MQDTPQFIWDVVIASDMAVAGTYTKAIKSVGYAIHIAWPIESGSRLRGDEFDDHLIRAAI